MREIIGKLQEKYNRLGMKELARNEANEGVDRSGASQPGRIWDCPRACCFPASASSLSEFGPLVFIFIFALLGLFD